MNVVPSEIWPLLPGQALWEELSEPKDGGVGLGEPGPFILHPVPWA